MNKKILRKFRFQNAYIKCVIEEDYVGWYLVIYAEPKSNVSTEDYLLDTAEDAFSEAEEKYKIPKNAWKEVNNNHSFF